MSGKYTFYVKTHTTGSLVESIYNFLIITNAPSLTFSSAITLYGIAEISAIGRLGISPYLARGEVSTNAEAAFSNIYCISGSWVGETHFIPFGDSNVGLAVEDFSLSGSWIGEIHFIPFGTSNAA